jgi:circadian clock protein KaiC
LLAIGLETSAPQVGVEGKLMQTLQPTGQLERVKTGVEGLDVILRGGLPPRRMHLVYGRPGVGKTTLALQFLIAGAEAGEAGVYVALSETADEIRDIAVAHRWQLPDALHLCDFQRPESDDDGGYTLFHPSEIELTDTTRRIIETMERIRPKRVVFDSLSEMRLMARDSLRYRRQVLALKQYFVDQGATVLLLDTRLASDTGEFQLETLTHGVLVLEHTAQLYGDARRRIRVEKMRGVSFIDGFHDFRILTGGLVVFPRLTAFVPADELIEPGASRVSSGVRALDAMTGGPLDRGTTTMVIGPAGVGKSTLTTQYVLAGLARGEKCAVFLFDEEPGKWRLRARWLGTEIDPHIDAGQLLLRYVNPSELTPGEFAHEIRRAQAAGAQTMVIDSFNGYRSAMPEEGFLTLHLHELFTYLNRKGVLTLVVAAQHGFLGEALEEPFKLSYLADSVLVMRYFEAFGRVRKAIAMIKRRTGAHEHHIRELELGPNGIDVGAPLAEFTGILSGELRYHGHEERLFANGVEQTAEGATTRP